MAEKLKKRPLSFVLKRTNIQKLGEESPSPKTAPTTPTPTSKASHAQFRFNGTLPKSSNNVYTRIRRLSTGGINELLQCSLCLEVLHNPKMLPCQHTFCLACLVVHIGDRPIFDCPICKTRIQVLGTGSDYVENLPSNLYIDSLLHLVANGDGGGTSNSVATPSTPLVSNSNSVDLFAGGSRCSQCKTICDSIDVTACRHCKLNFCRVCWPQHLDDLRIQLGSIVKQLDSASGRLQHKIEHYKDRCERITEQINLAADEKINAIIESKHVLLKEAMELQKSGNLTALAMKSSLEEATAVATRSMNNKGNTTDKEQVTTFVNLHQNVLQILSDVSKWDVDTFFFDKDNFRIEHETSTTIDAESDEPLPNCPRQKDPLATEENLVMHYRSRNFVPHYTWRKTSRPCGVGINPWDNNLYVCAMDSHCIIVVERSQAKIVKRLTCEDMLCPVHIAFMKSTGEIFVTDKWKHCIHVFSKDDEHLRTMGQKGSRVGSFRSPEGIATDNAHNLIYVVDTGNDRVQVLQPDGKFVDLIGVAIRLQPVNTSSVWETKEMSCTELNSPTSIAVTNDRVIILDSGNRRVKVYNKQDKCKISEFGALGYRKGQFRQPEVLAVDPMGFILVGDSGNCRVQVFKPNGQLVRVFGGMGSEPGKFGWISGIHVTKQLDIIISDTKNRSVSFF